MYKLTQFADDTTLILDGSVSSLQAALNTLEVFGNFSGLRMNREKTKVIWIGRKKYSKDKLYLPVDLDWGKSEFQLLGITFHVELSKMPELNLKNTLDKANIELTKWQSRQITPIGKIIVLKSLILSKFIHVFSILPIPNSFVKTLNLIFYKFLWNNKPDKIKRGTVCSSYAGGGLKMIDINEFIKSLKVCWIRRIICDPESQWLKLFHEMYGNEKKFHIESMWFNNINCKMTNGFWIEVMKSWQTLCHKCKLRSNADILNSCLWYNPKLARDPFYLSAWYKQGIYCIGDIVDNRGKVEAIEVLKNRYYFNINILDYYRVKLHVQNFISKNKFGENFHYARPSLPFHLKILMKSKKSFL